MGSSDPFPAEFEIWYGSLNFQVTGNDYLMCLTNCNELHPWQSIGLGLTPTTPATDTPAPAQAVVASTSMPRRRRRSSQHSLQARMELRQDTHAATRRDAPPPTDATQPHAEEHAVAGQRFPHEMRNAVATYASSVSTDMAAYKDLPGHHMLSAGNLIATTNDESYHGSASELPPMTSHCYTEWDFSGVLDPWCSDDSSMLETTGLVVLMTLASGAITPHLSASWSSSTNTLMARTERVMETRPRTWSQTHHRPVSGRHRHRRTAGPGARARG
jgi:hypothetical protein